MLIRLKRESPIGRLYIYFFSYHFHINRVYNNWKEPRTDEDSTDPKKTQFCNFHCKLPLWTVIKLSNFSCVFCVLLCFPCVNYFPSLFPAILPSGLAVWHRKRPTVTNRMEQTTSHGKIMQICNSVQDNTKNSFPLIETISIPHISTMVSICHPLRSGILLIEVFWGLLWRSS